MTQDYFLTFARYNRWANAKLYASCGQLSGPEYLKVRPAFFGSIHRTLNHILVGDLLWLARFQGQAHPVDRLDLELHPTFSELWENRQRMDFEIEAFVSGLSLTSLTQAFSYQLISQPGQWGQARLDLALAHFFNHQTHHRGQVHALLSQTELPPPSLDLIYFLSEANMNWAKA